MGCLGVVFGFFMLADVFDAKVWGDRQWGELIAALVLILGGWITGIFEDRA